MILHAGSCEPLKGRVHEALELLAVVCLSYNVCAFAARRETHLAVNVGLYTALVWWEHRAVRSHRTKEMHDDGGARGRTSRLVDRQDLRELRNEVNR